MAAPKTYKIMQYLDIIMLFFTLLFHILALYNQVLTTGESYIRIKHTLNNSSVPLTNNDGWITLRKYRTGNHT